jgi:hypothetical protein
MQTMAVVDLQQYRDLMQRTTAEQNETAEEPTESIDANSLPDSLALVLQAVPEIRRAATLLIFKYLSHSGRFLYHPDMHGNISIDSYLLGGTNFTDILYALVTPSIHKSSDKEYHVNGLTDFISLLATTPCPSNIIKNQQLRKQYLQFKQNVSPSHNEHCSR